MLCVIVNASEDIFCLKFGHLYVQSVTLLTQLNKHVQMLQMGDSLGWWELIKAVKYGMTESWLHLEFLTLVLQICSACPPCCLHFPLIIVNKLF